ncbi:MAG: hypothetical protein NVS4B8_19690 [Herpetosiphon sp.]
MFLRRFSRYWLLLGGMLIVAVLLGLLIGRANYMVGVVIFGLIALVIAGRYPIPALIMYLYVLALTPPYIGLDLRPFLPVNASRAAGLVVFGGLGIRMLFQVLGNKNRRFTPIHKYLLFLMAGVTLIPLANVSSSFTALVRDLLIYLLDFIAPAFFIAYFVRTKRDLSTIISHMFVAGLIVVALGSVEFVTRINPFTSMSPLLPGGEDWTSTLTRGSFVRVAVNFAQPISLGQYFALLVPLAVARFATAGTVRGQTWYALLTSLLFLGVIMALSGGPLFGTLLACVTFLVLRPGRTLRLGLTIGGIIGLLLTFTLSAKDILGVVAAFFGGQSVASDQVQTNAQVRFAVLQLAQKVVPTSPLLGFGSYKLIPYIPSILPNQDLVNTYIVYLLLYGAVGLALFLAVLVTSFVQCVKAVVASVDVAQQTIVIGLLASLIGQMGIMVGVSPVGVGSEFLWVLIGLIGALFWISQSEAVTEPTPPRAIVHAHELHPVTS